jgi:hypothetical protein
VPDLDEWCRKAVVVVALGQPVLRHLHVYAATTCWLVTSAIIFPTELHRPFKLAGQGLQEPACLALARSFILCFFRQDDVHYNICHSCTSHPSTIPAR